MEALKQMDVAGRVVTGIIHIGANDGQERFAYQAANVTPVIYVEPIEAVFNNLKKHVAGMPGHLPIQAVCSDKASERIVFNISSNNGESSSMLDLGQHAVLFPSVTYVAREDMTTTTVDAIVSALELPCRPNLLVVDTQGTELKVLQGAPDTLKTIDGIFVEVSEEPLYDGGCTHDDIREYLRGHDFDLKWLAINGMGHGDAFYCRKRANASRASANRGKQTPTEISIVEALSLLTPYDIDKIKGRVGPRQDGGYILLPELFDGQIVMSYGIGAEYRFDIDMASRGHTVLMFDHTIGGINHDGRDTGLRWIKEGVAGRRDHELGLDTLENQISRYVPGAGNLILKMDVEGFEYEAFDVTPRDVLRRFQQIVFEIHDLQRLAMTDFRQRFVRVLTKLNSDFTLFHVHANNVDGDNTYAFLSGVAVSNLLELSYVRTDLVERRQSHTLYPTPLDYPNIDPHDDKRLWFFPFLPSCVPAKHFSDADQRMKARAEGRQRRPQANIGTSMNTRPAADLINVAFGKPAKQSSLSEWSTVGEATNAVAEEFLGDFAFHTGRELGPWWQVDLLSVYPIEAIIVHNRRTSCQDRACTLKVEISERGDDWTVIHAGFAKFGSTRNGLPLELTVGGKLEARYVRLSLTENEYLHLSQVEVLVRPDLLAFCAFCTRHRLPHYFAQKHPTRYPYVLERAENAVSYEIVGLKINRCGRFGNLLHQSINVIRLAKRTGLKIIQLGYHELLDVKTAFTLQGITFLPSQASLPADGAFISGDFFNTDDFMPVLQPFLRFRPEDELEFTNIAHDFVRLHMLTGIPIPGESHPADELTIHIRAGDIFSSDHPEAGLCYRQPPLSFYILVISRMRDDGRINKVRLVFEDRGNPCVDALEIWLEQQSIPYRVTSGSLHQDMSALVDAPHLVFGYGTFGYAACRLSKTIETVHFFEPELGGRYEYIPTIGEVFVVSDRAGKYSKAWTYGEPFDAKDAWHNTPELRALMLDYPIDWLQVEELAVTQQTTPREVGTRARRIIYLCPADNLPTGGIKVIYRHAELLASLGADAYVLHPFDTDFQCSWFDHSVPLLRSLALNPDEDFVIIPELWAATFGPQCIDQHVRFAIFVQNGYLTNPVLREQPPELFARVYQAADLVLSISEDSERMTALNYPRADPTRLVRVQYSIPERFLRRHHLEAASPPCITFMPRKMDTHAARVAFALRQHLAPQWEIKSIHNVDEETVATMLASSSIFLSFSEFEGLPLPPLEAALAGNLVIGYTGQGAREYWDKPNFQEIHQGDIRGFVGAVIQAAQSIDTQRLTHAHLAPGIAQLAVRFSLAAEIASLQTLLSRIECCLIQPPTSVASANEATVA